MVNPIRIDASGANLIIVNDDGSRRMAYDDGAQGWRVGAPAKAPGPGPTPTGKWRWPFPASAITPGREWQDPQDPSHNGLDFGMPPALSGAKIHCIGPGTVVANSWEPFGFGGGGYVVIVDHGIVMGKPWFSSYNHMDYPGPVEVGQKVGSETVIGDIGNSGFSFGAHLHLQMQQVKQWSSTTFNPRTFLDDVKATGK